MKIGDVVVPVGDTVLACGTGLYDCAIIANLKPFALVSLDGDMMWMGDKPEDYKSLCQAAPDIVQRAVRRYESDVLVHIRRHSY